MTTPGVGSAGGVNRGPARGLNGRRTGLGARAGPPGGPLLPSAQVVHEAHHRERRPTQRHRPGRLTRPGRGRLFARGRPPAGCRRRGRATGKVPSDPPPTALPERPPWPRPSSRRSSQAHAVGLTPGSEVRAGDYVTLTPDHVMTHDNTSAVHGQVQGPGRRRRCKNPRQPVFTLDHNIQDLGESNQAKYARHRRVRRRANGVDLLSAPAAASATRSWSRRASSGPAASAWPATATATPTAPSAPWARRWCAPTRPRSGPPAPCGGRCRAR